MRIKVCVGSYSNGSVIIMNIIIIIIKELGFGGFHPVEKKLEQVLVEISETNRSVIKTEHPVERKLEALRTPKSHVCSEQHKGPRRFTGWIRWIHPPAPCRKQTGGALVPPVIHATGYKL